MISKFKISLFISFLFLNLKFVSLIMKLFMSFLKLLNSLKILKSMKISSVSKTILQIFYFSFKFICNKSIIKFLLNFTIVSTLLDYNIFEFFRLLSSIDNKYIRRLSNLTFPCSLNLWSSPKLNDQFKLGISTYI